jgi:hypothetical protein
VTADAGGAAGVPLEYALYQNCPNAFNFYGFREGGFVRTRTMLLLK